MVKLTESLVLARARASDIENVRKLNCWGSDLSDVSILRRMINVQVVSLSVNKIATLADFAFCHNLEELYIRKNTISDLAEICYLRKLPKLRILWLSDNPCAVGDRYRMTVLRTLPNLTKLDNMGVQEDEVNSAIELGMELTLDDSSSTVNGTDVRTPSVPDNQEVVEQRVNRGEVEREESRRDNPVSLSIEETNSNDEPSSQIRAQLGLKPLPIDKIISPPPKPRYHFGAKSRNANLLQAAICIVKELDSDSLETLADVIHSRLDSL